MFIRRPTGTVRVFNTDGVLVHQQSNQIQDGYKDILSHLLAGDITSKPSAFLIEFQNSSTATTDSSFPSSEGVEYYQSLSSPKDYLRCVITGTPDILDGSVTFGALVDSGTGLANSVSTNDATRLLGGALVADAGQETYMFSRFCFTSPIVLGGGQYYITWTLTWA